MFRKLTILVVSLSMISTTLASEATPDATPSQIFVFFECEQIPDYDDELQTQLDQTDIETFDGDDLPKMRPSELRDLADQFYQLAEYFETMDEVPRVALDYHELVIDNLSLYGNLLTSAATSGVFGALAYVESINETLIAMQGAWNTAESRCGVLWSDAFPGGIDGGLLPETESE